MSWNAADLKPHRSVYWLNSHDPDFDAKAQAICKLYVQSPVLYQHGELVICTDEKTGMQILQRKHPTIAAQPGKPEKREHEYIRHGTRCLIASFLVPTGQVVWDLGVTRTSVDFTAHLNHVALQFPDHQRFHWILDNLNTHWSLDVCELMARLNGLPFHKKSLRTGARRHAFLTDPDHTHIFHFTPKHGSWLNQVELWFSTLARRFLKRGDFASAAEFVTRITAYLDDHNACRAHPYRWTYSGQPFSSAPPSAKRVDSSVSVGLGSAPVHSVSSNSSTHRAPTDARHSPTAQRLVKSSSSSTVPSGQWHEFLPRSGYITQPRVAAQRLPWGGHGAIIQPLQGVDNGPPPLPRVAAARQPWAVLCNHFVVKTNVTWPRDAAYLNAVTIAVFQAGDEEVRHIDRLLFVASSSTHSAAVSNPRSSPARLAIARHRSRTSGAISRARALLMCPQVRRRGPRARPTPSLVTRAALSG